ncbi:MAG: tetratricopeptide repeat protein [Bryobacteraceae bacterium]
MHDLPSELIDAAPANADFLCDIERLLTTSYPIPLVPFVGAGLSIHMGFPSWTAFLIQLGVESGISAQVAKLVTAGAYEEAANVVEDALGPSIFHRRVSQTFGQAKSYACDLNGAVKVLPELMPGPVVTTNFDRVIERVFEEADMPFEYVSWGAQVDQMRRAIQENRPFLLKLHGDGEDRSARVLTKVEYERHYGSDDPNSLRAQLRRALQGRTFLFMGCSLGADRTMTVLEEAIQQASGIEHFAIIERPAEEDQFFAKQRSLGHRSILPIWYPNGQHHLVEPFLRWIAQLQPSNRPVEPELVLERPERRKCDVCSELDLLIPYQRITEHAGRSHELDSLRDWLASEQTVSVRVITGAGGSGKTRLAIELIEWLESAEPDRWHQGFLTTSEMERFSRLRNLAEWKHRKPVLAVVDYAAGSSEILRVWLDQLASAAPDGEKLRLLLLEREASLEEGWLASALTQGHAASVVRGWFDPPKPLKLDKLTTSVDRRNVLKATLREATKLRDVHVSDLPAEGADPAFDQQLTDPQWGDPLTLMMAGLTALETGLPSALAMNRADLALHLATRECERVARFAPNAPRGLMEHMAAYVTLSGGLPRGLLRVAAKAESESIGLNHPEGWRSLSGCVEDALRGAEGTRPIEPNVVGEAVLLHVWGAEEVSEGCSAVVRAAEFRPAQAVASVVRCAQDFCVGKSPREEPLRWLDSLIAEGKRNLPLLWAIEATLPQKTLALRERAVEVEFALAKRLDEGTELAPPVTALATRARVLNSLGYRLSEVGRRGEALEASEESLRLRRQLAAQCPDAFLSDLAVSLNNLGAMLSEVGRREEALEAVAEAVQVYRQLVEQSPNAFLPTLAMSLSNLGAMRGMLGQQEEVLEVVAESVDIYRQLAAQRPDVFLSDLADTVHNLGNGLSRVGRREEALEASEEAVRLRRQLAAQRPDAFLPDLAMSLDSLGNRLSELDRQQEALVASQESVCVYRGLAEQLPNAFLPNLAHSLQNLGIRLSDVGRREEALDATREAVTLRKQLVEQSPDAFLPDLAISLRALAKGLDDMGRRQEAIEAGEQAVSIYRNLATQSPSAFRPDLAGSLSDHCVRLRGLGRQADAIGANEEALRFYRQLSVQRPNVFLPILARSLEDFGNRLNQLGRHEEALVASEEALHVWQQLVAQSPDHFLPYLAGSFNNLGVRLSELKRHGEALRASEEAVRLYRQLAAQNPEVFLPQVAMSLDNVGIWLCRLGRYKEALVASEEAVRLYRQLAVQSPEVFLPQVAMSLSTRGTTLGSSGHAAAAAASLRESIQVLKPSFLSQPQAHQRLMRSLVEIYQHACKTAATDADTSLLGEIIPLLTDGAAPSDGKG